jgi:hypothetical protein
MADYTRIVGTLFCGSVTLASAVASLDRLSKYASSALESSVHELIVHTTVSDASYAAALSIGDSMTYNNDLVHCIGYAVGAAIFAGITIYYAKPDQDEKKI